MTDEPGPFDATGDLILVPLPGFASDEARLTIGDLELVVIDAWEWRNMEPYRITDMYLHFYAAMPRYYLMRPVASDESEDTAVTDALDSARDVVLALRLLADGDVIGPEFVVWYKRDRSGMNLRPSPDLYRSRFLTVAFGDPPPVKAFKRTLGDTTDTYHDSLLSLGGEPFGLARVDVPIVAEMLDLVRLYRRRATPDVDLAVRNFDTGRSRLSSARHRLVSMFASLEAIYGGFHARPSPPSLGQRVAIGMNVPPEEIEQVVESIDVFVRDARNAVAHGGDHRQLIDWEDVRGALSNVLQQSLPPVMRIAGWDDADWEHCEAVTRSSTKAPTRAFQRLLVECWRGNEEARALVVALQG